MISVNPQGLVYLCRTPLENDYKNQLTFANATAQLNYFNSKVVTSFDNYTYIRKDNTIKVGVPIDEIINCNYLFYQNKGFTSKYYFCFITDMTYINENCTLITIETDVYQTWLFDINYKACFVEREHVNDDTIGLHTIPEGLETGEYIRNTSTSSGTDATENLEFLHNINVVVAVTHKPQGVTGNSYAQYNGVYSGLQYYAVKTGQDLINFITDTEETTDCEIYAIFMAPTKLIHETGTTITWSTSTSDNAYEYYKVTGSNTYARMGNATIYRPTGLDTYYPKNNKLLVYPYQYLIITNHAGGNATYKYEEFDSNSCSFAVRGAVGVGCDIKLVPNNSINGRELHTLSAQKLPTCGWISDAYTNWLTQNAVNIKLETIGNVANMAIGGGEMLLTGSYAGVDRVLEGVGGIFGQVKERYNHSIVPDEAKGGLNEGNVNFTSTDGFTYYKMSIKREYATIIDSYLSAFGYKVNTFKIPNITGRNNWNYVKTIDCNFEGDIPQEDLNKIKNMFNAGVTLWHNPATMYDYTANNGIV